MTAAPVLIMAGGTGGHVMPALSVAAELARRDVPVVWLGTRAGIEASLVPEHGIPIEWLQVAGLRGGGVASWLAAPLRLLRAIWRARAVLRRHRPRAVLGMGGFAAGPGGVAAWLSRVPLVIHEQNAVAGLTNRVLSRLARETLCGFEGAFNDRVRVRVVGNPVREAMFAVPDPETRFAAPPDRVRLLVLGGSQGALALNRTVPEALALLPEAMRPEVVHQAGERTLETAREAYARAGVAATVTPFIADMAEAYAHAHLVIARAGALTVAEIAAVGVGAVFVPYPYAVDDHQTRNAQALVDDGAAECIAEAGLDAPGLAARLERLLGAPDRLRAMAIAARRHAAPDAAGKVADALLAEVPA